MLQKHAMIWPVKIDKYKVGSELVPTKREYFTVFASKQVYVLLFW